MNRTKMNPKVKKVTLRAISAICVCALAICAFTQIAKAAEYKSPESTTAKYGIHSISGALNFKAPQGYAKSNYKVKLVETTDRPAKRDLSKETAAELGAQNLWRLFGEKLKNETIYMTYLPSSDSQPQALWYGEVDINEKLFYSFQVDAVTGEFHTTSRWDYSKEIGETTEFLKSYKEFLLLAKKAAEKYQLVSGKMRSIEYIQQRTMGPGNVVIDILVKSDNGQQVQLTFSTYSKALTFVCYSAELQREKMNMERLTICAYRGIITAN